MSDLLTNIFSDFKNNLIGASGTSKKEEPKGPDFDALISQLPENMRTPEVRAEIEETYKRLKGALGPDFEVQGFSMSKQRSTSNIIHEMETLKGIYDRAKELGDKHVQAYALTCLNCLMWTISRDDSDILGPVKELERQMKAMCNKPGCDCKDRTL